MNTYLKIVTAKNEDDKAEYVLFIVTLQRISGCIFPPEKIIYVRIIGETIIE